MEGKYMMNLKQKEDVRKRLNKIAGQIQGVGKMVTDNRYCIDILTQTRAVISAMRKVEDLIMHQHLETCVADSMRSNNPQEQSEKINEVMDMISRFRRTG
jgi:CsoR family transcriptional regulator, copper-sensing transcriptional repressor